MRAADWKRLSKPALTSTEADWGWARALAYIQPVEWVVHGVLGEDSHGRKDEFYLWIVRMPLMAPLDGVVDLSWSERHGCGTTTYHRDSSGMEEAIAEAASIAVRNTRAGGVLLDPPGGADNGRMQEARAYGLLLNGDEAGAREVLWRVEQYDAKYDWERELVNRAARMRSLIESQQAGVARDQLQRWRAENCDALGLSCG